MALTEMDLVNLKSKMANSKHKLTICFMISFFIYSCSAYDKASQYNTFSNEDGFVKYQNDTLGIDMLLYGDFKFANNQEEYNTLSLKDKYPSRKRIIYGLTTDPAYYFNISLVKNGKASKLDTIKDLSCVNGLKSRLAVSKKAPKSDIKFLLDNFKCIK